MSYDIELDGVHHYVMDTPLVIGTLLHMLMVREEPFTMTPNYYREPTMNVQTFLALNHSTLHDDFANRKRQAK